MRITLLKNIPEDAALQRQWNQLVLQMNGAEVAYNCEWALAVQAAYQGSRKPLVFLGYDGDDLAGVVCLATEPDREAVSFLTANTADYCEFLSHPERRTEFVEGVFAELRKIGVSDLVLANLPADSVTPDALRAAARKHGFHLYIRPAYFCPQVKLGGEAERLELKTTVARKRQLKRCLKALEREGPVTCTFLREWKDVETVLPNFAKAHVARFKTTQHVSFLSAPERQVFMEELARRACASGLMTLTVLKVGVRSLAWSYGFQFQGVWFLYQTTFDTSEAENSPGYCLLGKILIEACGMNSLRVVDMGLGAEVYKEWFANSSRETLYATVTTSRLRHVREVARYRLATELKRYPKLEDTIRNLRSKLRP